MDSLANINLSVVQSQALKLYNHQYFDYIITATTLSIAFIFGRLVHQRKFTNLLSMINDAQSTKKTINRQKNQIQQSIWKAQQKKYLFLSLLFIVSAVIGAYCYFMKNNIDLNLLIKVISGIIVIVLVVWIRLRYLKWKRGQLEKKLRQSQLTTENQVKQILQQIGPQIAQSLKFKLERQIQENFRKEQQKQCQLSKCANQKRTYEKLNSLYKTIISEMTKFTWCKTCASQSNINLIDLNLQQLDANLTLYRKLASDSKFLSNTQKCKQLVNKMLEEWAHLQPKLEFVCKRGCCIKFRQLVEGLKKQHFRSLNDLKTSLK